MLKAIEISRPLKVGRIVLDDAEPLTDKIIFLTDNYLIVADGENDDHPTWYNKNIIARLEGVEVIERPYMMQEVKICR